MSDDDGVVPFVNKAKKNKKRKKASQPSSAKKDEPDYNDMLTKLKQKLEEAKTGNDHAKASELRNLVWVLTDMSHGVRTNISEEDLDKIMEGIHRELSLPANFADSASLKKGDDNAGGSSSAVTGLQSNRLRNLQKKLDQIEALKERLKKGEKLEANQVEKIKSESAVREEMQTLTDILSNIEIKQ